MEKYLKEENFKGKGFKVEPKYDGEGMETIIVSSLDEFHKLIQIFSKNINNSNDRYLDYYIWRGQEKEEKELIPGFYRKSKYKDLERRDREKELKKILNTFKKRLKELPPNPLFKFEELKKEDDTIWAIGQHYGLLTPLLDWTEVPYYALYFAFYKKSKGQKNRVIYALNRPEINRRILKIKEPVTKKVIEIKRIIPDIKYLPYIQNKRLIAQRSLFTKYYEKAKIEDSSKRVSKNSSKVILMKVIISNHLQNDCLNLLESMGITHGSLFPDYSGAVDICKIDLGLENLKCC